MWKFHSSDPARPYFHVIATSGFMTFDLRVDLKVKYLKCILKNKFIPFYCSHEPHNSQLLPFYGMTFKFKGQGHDLHSCLDLYEPWGNVLFKGTQQQTSTANTEWVRRQNREFKQKMPLYTHYEFTINSKITDNAPGLSLILINIESKPLHNWLEAKIAKCNPKNAIMHSFWFFF